MFIVGKSFFSETLSKFNIKTIAPLCVIHIPQKMLAVGPQAHNIDEFLPCMSQAGRPTWGRDTLPSQRVPQKILKKKYLPILYIYSLACFVPQSNITYKYQWNHEEGEFSFIHNLIYFMKGRGPGAQLIEHLLFTLLKIIKSILAETFTKISEFQMLGIAGDRKWFSELQFLR